MLLVLFGGVRNGNLHALRSASALGPTKVTYLCLGGAVNTRHPIASIWRFVMPK